MSDALQKFNKTKQYLICVDSDGCAMDTMDIKHFRCFGPCMVEEWELGQWSDEILAFWNDLNLYTMTRGINRFKGLAKALQEIDKKYRAIEDLDSIVRFAGESAQLSNDALEKAIEKDPDSIGLKKALSWSIAVNKSIDRIPEEEKKPYEGVRDALAYAHRHADIAIVSSANLNAVLAEWDIHGLLEYTDIVLAQDAGSKAHCIGELLGKGYAPDRVLMCGDAPGDMDAAKSNGVFYYPILVRHEKESWEEFVSVGLNHLLEGTYSGDYQQEKIKRFLENLGG